MALPFPKPFHRTHDGEPELTLARAMEDMRAKTGAHIAMWGLDESSWAADLDLGTITFTNPKRGLIVTAPVQVIGTFNTLDNSWLWGWDHPSVPEPLAAEARLARSFGEKYDLPRFTERLFESSTDEAWLFTAVASLLAKSQCGYRGPAGTALVFMTFGTVAMRKA